MGSPCQNKAEDWQGVLEKNPHNQTTNKNLERIAELMTTADKDVSNAIEKLVQEDSFVWMFKSSSFSSGCADGSDKMHNSSQLSLLHHLTMLEEEKEEKNSSRTALRKKKESPPIFAALQGTSSTAQPVEIAVKEVFEKKIEIKAPAWNTLKSIDSKEKALSTIIASDSTTAAKKARGAAASNASSNAAATKYIIRHIQVLPPFLHQALMKSKDHSPAALLVEALRAIQAHDKAHEHDKTFDRADVFCRGIVAYIWNAAQIGSESKIKEISVATTKSAKVLDWSKSMHQQYIRSGDGDGPSLSRDDADNKEKPPTKVEPSESAQTDSNSPQDKKMAAKPSEASESAENIQNNGKENPTKEPNPKPAAKSTENATEEATFHNAVADKPDPPPGITKEADCIGKAEPEGGKYNSAVISIPVAGISTEAVKEESESTEAATEKTEKLFGRKGKVRTWEESFQRLVQYKEVHGDCNVPREYTEDKALGEWVKNQRSVQKTLSKERKSKLEDIGFTFSNTQQDRSNKNWEAQFQKFKAYVEIHGPGTKSSSTTSKSGDTKEDRAIQHWMSVQRQNFKRGVLSEERQKKLDEVGFVWKLKNEYKPRNKNDKQWLKGYDNLKHFYEEHKHCNVPKRPACNRPLWEWVYAQRKAYNEKRLPDERITAMEELGMVWDTDMGQVIRDEQWTAKYNEAKSFREQHGHLEIPRSGKFGSTNLLKWLLRQREQFKNDKLDSARKKLLDDLGFDFHGHQDHREKLLEQLLWKERYQDLQAYKKEHNTTKIPDKHHFLTKWIAKQQVAYQFRDLESGRKKLLDELGVEFAEQVPEDAAASAKTGGSSAEKGSSTSAPSAPAGNGAKPVANSANENSSKRKADDGDPAAKKHGTEVEKAKEVSKDGTKAEVVVKAEAGGEEKESEKKHPADAPLEPPEKRSKTAQV